MLRGAWLPDSALVRALVWTAKPRGSSPSSGTIFSFVSVQFQLNIECYLLLKSIFYVCLSKKQIYASINTTKYPTESIPVPKLFEFKEPNANSNRKIIFDTVMSKGLHMLITKSLRVTKGAPGGACRMATCKIHYK